MRIIFDGKKCLKEYEKALRSAKKRIWIGMYIIRFDDVTKRLWRILEEKYEEGVEVVVHYDVWGCWPALYQLTGCPFAHGFLPRWNRLLTRNHSKIIIVDDEVAIVSGRNFKRKYFEWVDASIFLTKKEHVSLINQFAKRIEQKPYKPIAHDALISYTDPLAGQKNVYNFVLENIVKAQKTITILSPYFVLDDAIEELLRAAMDRGVIVTVIIPKRPDHKFMRMVNRINFQRIHHKNLRLQRNEKMFHSKVMLFDDVALVGSANFDNLSFKRNFEVSVKMEKKHLPAIRRHVREVADHSVKYGRLQRAYDTLVYHLLRHLMEFM